MTASNSKPSIAVIDYLRGIAALGVAVYHVRVPLWVGWREITAHPGLYSASDRAAAWLSAPAPFLGSFVMLFFVISGFCVHLPQAGKTKPLVYRAYFWRRFLRIYPPYLAAVLISAGLLVASGGLAGHGGWGSAAASALMVQNYTGGVTGGVEMGQIPNDPALWSLPVEMELYLVYPLMLACLRRWSPARMLAVTGLVSVLAGVACSAGEHWLIGNFARFWIIWCSGAWLAEQWVRDELRAPPLGLGLAALAALAYSIHFNRHNQDPWAGNYAYALFFFWAIWLLLSRPELWTGLPGILSRSLGWLGTVSYSLYLLHFPLLFLLGGWWVSIFDGKPTSFLVPLAACALILPVVGLFYLVVEKPSHRLAKRMAAGCH